MKIASLLVISYVSILMAYAQDVPDPNEVPRFPFRRVESSEVTEESISLAGQSPIVPTTNNNMTEINRNFNNVPRIENLPQGISQPDSPMPRRFGGCYGKPIVDFFNEDKTQPESPK